jgi:hypothetical protein
LELHITGRKKPDKSLQTSLQSQDTNRDVSNAIFGFHTSPSHLRGHPMGSESPADKSTGTAIGKLPFYTAMQQDMWLLFSHSKNIS